MVEQMTHNKHCKDYARKAGGKSGGKSLIGYKDQPHVHVRVIKS